MADESCRGFVHNFCWLGSYLQDFLQRSGVASKSCRCSVDRGCNSTYIIEEAVEMSIDAVIVVDTVIE